MSIIFSDTGCDVPQEAIKNFDIKIIQIPFTLGEKEYVDQSQITIKEFYDEIKEGKVAKTCSLNPQLYIETFEPYLKEGKDIIYVHFSSQLSGTFNQLKVAINELKEKYPQRQIDAIDTLNISAGSGILAWEVAKRNKDGMPHKELVLWAEQNKNQFSTYFYVDDLKYLKRGGRISAATAIIGTMLQIKPVITCASSGKLEILGKAIGKKKAQNELINYVIKYGKNIKEWPIIIMHSASEPTALELRDLLLDKLGANTKIIVTEVGTTVGTHTGPGVVAVFFHGEQLIIEKK